MMRDRPAPRAPLNFRISGTLMPSPAAPAETDAGRPLLRVE